MANLSIKKTEEREDLWRRLLEATGESTIAGALDIAARHYLQDLRSKQRIGSSVDELTLQEALDELDSPYLPIEREHSVTVGRAD